MKRLSVLSLLFPLAILGGACELQKSENPLSPTVAGPIPGVEISAPKTLEPATGWQIPGDRQPLTLLLENANSNGQRPLSYLFEVAADAGFSNKVFVQEGVQPGDGGRTSLRLPDALQSGRAYYWRAKAQDGANTGPYSAAAAFNVFTPVSFGAPNPLSPTNGTKTSSASPEFHWGNASRAGSPAYVAYALEVSTTDSFSTKLVSWQIDETPGNDTRFTAVSGFPSDSQLFWRVRAFEGGTLGPWSATAVFRTPVVVVAPPPSTPSPGLPPGAPCTSATSHLGVVECRRKQYGNMDQAATNAFLRGVAKDLNAGNFSGGVFGIYEKTSGNQCLGYSCDLICSSTGGAWDVLYDWEGPQTPIWFYKGSDGYHNPKCLLVR